MRMARNGPWNGFGMCLCVGTVIERALVRSMGSSASSLLLHVALVSSSRSLVSSASRPRLLSRSGCRSSVLGWRLRAKLLRLGRCRFSAGRRAQRSRRGLGSARWSSQGCIGDRRVHVGPGDRSGWDGLLSCGGQSCACAEDQRWQGGRRERSRWMELVTNFFPQESDWRTATFPPPARVGDAAPPYAVGCRISGANSSRLHQCPFSQTPSTVVCVQLATSIRRGPR